MRYLEMLLSIGYGGGGVQWDDGTRGSCGCSPCVGLSELMSAFMGMWVPIIGDTAETKRAAVSFIVLFYLGITSYHLKQMGARRGGAITFNTIFIAS